MGKSKGKSSRKKGGQVEEVVQCPHLHFKTDVIDRNVLSKEQHLNLLSTPKGYRWEEYQKEGGDGGPVEELSAPRRIMCSGRRMKKAEKVYVHNFLAEVWNLLTPEMVDRLKGMLMNEFGMSPQEADDFIWKQREGNIVNSSTVSLYKKPRDLGDGKYVYDHVVKLRNPNKAHCDKLPKSNLGIRNTWIKEFSDSLSDMMSTYVLETMCAERNDRQQEIAQTLLNRFSTLLEHKTSMSDPKTPTDKTLVLIADRLATWLDNNVGVSKEAAQQIKITEEVERRKKMDEDRKRRQEEMKKQREIREAEEQARKLAEEQARKLADEQAQKPPKEGEDEKLFDEQQAQKPAEEEEAQKLAEGEYKEKSPGGSDEPTAGEFQDAPVGEQPEGPAAEQNQEGEAYKAKEEQPKKETDEANGEAGKPEVAEGTEQGKQNEKEEEAAAAAAEQQRALDDVKQKEEDEKAAVAAAAAEAEKLKAEDEQESAKQEEAKAEQQRADEEQKNAEQEATEAAEKQRTDEEQKKAEQEVAEAENQNADVQQIRTDQEAAEAAETEKQMAEDEQKKKLEEDNAEPKTDSEEPGDEKPVAGLSEQPLEPTDVPAEDMTPSETTESEPPASDVEDEPVPVALTEKGDEVEPITRLEETPVDEITPEVAHPEERGLSPEEKEKRTNEVLKSVASIILETRIDTSPRQEALKDIMEKQLEENLGDKDKEAIDKVSSKIGTWIDKMVDQATLEYGERESSRPPPGPQDIWAPASSRAQPPISAPGGMRAPAEIGLVPGVSRAPTEPGWGREVAGSPIQPGLVPGTPTQPGRIPGVTGAPTQPGWVPGVSTALGQPNRVPGFGPTVDEPGRVPGVSAVQDSGAPGTRVPVAQRPKGRIYHVSGAGSGFDVNTISNTRAQEKIRLARGKSPAYDNVPNPGAPMEPADLKSWYKWTSALSEVAESWGEWIKDTIKGTEMRGEEMARDSSPQRLSEWREFRENRAQSANRWQRTKKDMEQRAEMWSKKGRTVQSQ